MSQKPIEKLKHKIDVETILKCLWAIRDKEYFYFEEYGKEMINNLLKQNVKKK